MSASAEALANLMAQLEPAAVAVAPYNGRELWETSVAISLRRIADALAPRTTPVAPERASTVDMRLADPDCFRKGPEHGPEACCDCWIPF